MIEAIVDDLEIPNERVAWMHVAEDMQKPAFNRTETEMSRIMTMLLRLRFFQGMPFGERLHFAKTMAFRRADLGEVLYTTASSPFEPHPPAAAVGAQVRAHSDSSPTAAAAVSKEVPPTPPPPPFCIIVFGSVGLQRSAATGRVQTLLETGDTFGSPLVTDALPQGSTYVAVTPVELLCISAESYRERLIKHDEEEVARRVAFFRKLLVPVFATMADHELDRLARTVYPVSFQCKELVVREGEPGDSFYFILKGKLKVVREVEFTQITGAPSVKLLELATLVEGEYFGELSFLRISVDANRKGQLPKLSHEGDFLEGDDSDDELNARQLSPLLAPHPRQATVYAHSPCTLLAMSRSAFIDQISGATLLRMREYAKGYPTQQEIRAHFSRRQHWDTFKADVMARVVGQRHQV